MEKINGREAVSILAEVKAGKRELSDSDLHYVKKQVMSFCDWLAKKAKITPEDALERVKRMIASEKKLLLEEDTFQDFTWSRGNEVGDLEISITGALDQDFEKASNEAHKAELEYWNHMERVAERNVGKYPDEVWAVSRELMERICETLNGLKMSGRLLSDSDVRRYLFKCNKRINALRFGKKPLLLNKHWKLCKNLVNEMLGINKRYEIKGPVEKTEEEKVDAMENAVYGFFESNQLYK